MTQKKQNPAIQKYSEDELLIDFNLSRNMSAWCLHCEKEFSVKDVLDNQEGDWCPNPGCDGGGWGIDLFAEKWWV